jgi:F-type H+-transporting ATPase subunit gamma
MAKARAIVKRRRAAKNIRRITETMELISRARFAKCAQRAQAGRPYVENISHMVEALSGAGTVEHPLLKPNAGVSAAILLTITSNRGLCGSYNASVLRLGIETLRTMRSEGLEPAIEMVGKKGVGYMRFLQVTPAQAITDVEDKIAYARVAAMADRYIQLYESRQIARVNVVSTRYISAAQQRTTVTPLLPIEPPARSDTATRSQVNFEFSPPAPILLARLIPQTVRIRLYQLFNEAIVSEQAARMVAMKSATDAAGDMIKYLTRQYNRARQTQITMELADIVGGAEAVK